MGVDVISIFSLIYRSTKYIDSLYDSLLRFTPMLETGEAEFFFVANDATENVKRHLKERGIPHVVWTNDVVPLGEMQARGYAHPEYMRRVYRGYNFGIDQCELVAVGKSIYTTLPGGLGDIVGPIL